MKPNLIAPLYTPAREFREPTRAPFEFGVETVTIDELMSAPSTRAIVTKHAPWATAMYQSALFSPHRSNFALRDMASFMPMDCSKAIAEVDAALRLLPINERPHHVQ